MNKFSLPPQSAVENVFTYSTTEKFHFAPLKKVFSLPFPWGFPVIHFYAHTKMRPPSLRALYWYKHLKRGGKRDKGRSSELLDLWNIKRIKVSENLSANPKPYQLSLPLPRGNPCRMFRKEVLKGETAEAQLNMASKRNKKHTAERQFPVCTPATVCTPRESTCFRTFILRNIIAVTKYLTEQHTLFPS